VPDQKFFDPTSGTELVSIHWDFGLTSVDVAFGGSLLTKITDINQLRTTGLSGATPDGGSLVIQLGFADAFEVTRNGERLTPSDVNAFTHAPGAGTLLAGEVDNKLSLDAAGRLVMNGKRVDEKAMGMLSSGGSSSAAAGSLQSARIWLLFFSIVQTLFALSLCYATYELMTITGDEPDGIASGIFAAIRGVVVAVTLFVAGCAAGSWILWKAADGPYARKAMTISKWVAAAYFGLTLLNTLSGLGANPTKALVGAVIPMVIEVLAFLAFKRAQEALPES
jgi:hypothetical protein